jgi:type II secretory ATPase GspE/PulE/Tfp pilus assembly ATPase PilB-like protein
MAFVKGAGCDTCHFVGYRGRRLVAELWLPDEADMLLIMREAPFDEIRRSAVRTTLSMARDAHARLAAGITTLEELVRVLPDTASAGQRELVASG